MYYIYYRGRNEQDRQAVRYCHVTEKKIKNVEELHIGDHISFNRRRCFLWCGPLYKHHAIVLNITDSERNTANKDVELIEFDAQQCNCSSGRCNCSSSKLTIIEKKYTCQDQTEWYNGKLQKLIYHFSGNVSLPDAEMIIQNARSIEHDNPSYSLFKYNCEHFCHEACTGVKYSEQTQRVSSCLTFLVKGLVRLCFLGSLLLDDILWKETTCRITVPALIIAVNCILYVILNYNFKHIFVDFSVSRKFIYKKFCSQCKCNRKIETGLGFILLPIGQGLGLWLNIHLNDRYGTPVHYLALISVGISLLTFLVLYCLTKICQRCCQKRNRGHANMV